MKSVLGVYPARFGIGLCLCMLLALAAGCGSSNCGKASCATKDAYEEVIFDGSVVEGTIVDADASDEGPYEVMSAEEYAAIMGESAEDYDEAEYDEIEDDGMVVSEVYRPSNIVGGVVHDASFEDGSYVTDNDLVKK